MAASSNSARLDIVVANAGIGTPGAMLDEMDEPRWQQMIDVNLSGVWKSVKAAVPHVKAGGRGGSVILTSSVGGLKAYPHVGHYVTAKHGVVGLMRTFAVELGQFSIRVNSVHPTHVATALLLNESTYQAFRPDLENPGTDDIGPDLPELPHAADPLGGGRGRQQCGVVPRIRRIPLCHRGSPSHRCRQLPEVGRACRSRWRWRFRSEPARAVRHARLPRLWEGVSACPCGGLRRNRVPPLRLARTYTGPSADPSWSHPMTAGT